MKDLRKHKRKPLYSWVKEECEDYFFTHESANISEGGLFLKRKIIGEKQQTGTYKFYLPISNEQITVEGRTVYCKCLKDDKNTETNGVGIEFTNISEKAQKLIRDYINTKSH